MSNNIKTKVSDVPKKATLHVGDLDAGTCFQWLYYENSEGVMIAGDEEGYMYLKTGREFKKEGLMGSSEPVVIVEPRNPFLFDQKGP